MNYGAPPTPVPAGKPRLRGRTPLRLALILGVLGVVGIVVGAIIAYNGALKKVDDFSRIEVPTASEQSNTDTIDFGTGGYVVYYEAPDATSDAIPPIPVTLTGPSGTSQSLKTPYGGTAGSTTVKTLTYDIDGHKGVALWQFTLSEAGTYTVEVGGDPRANDAASVAFGRSIGTSTAVGGVLLVVGVLFVVTAIILLIIGLVKRSRHKRELATAGSYGYPPPGYQPGYPPQGYPQQGYPQQGYPPPGYPQGYPPSPPPPPPGS